MTREEYFIMKIRQLNILRREERHIQEQIKEIQNELEPLSNQEFSKLKVIADGFDGYKQNGRK